ncbi:MAG: SDR family NAD(P)-dependent oxidoreductase, partial [Candidatus Wolfebacteria bacterium]|nr:SDR family NAD(P)-dependent oxidoreductase [Candidatus Wolfebacteria bacterium]
AGVAKDGSFIKSIEEDWDFMWSVNVKGVFLVTQEALRVMGEGKDKVIINIASGAGIHGIGDLSIYSATKAAVINFTQSLNDELKDKVRVITVAPGSTDTKMFHSLWPSEKARHTPEQVGEVIYKTITGEILPDEHFIVDVFYHTR